MAKQFFIGTSLFLLILFFLWGLYTFLLAPEKPKVVQQEIPKTEDVITQPEKQKSLQVVIDAPVISPFTTSNASGNFIFYIDKNTGSLQKINLSTKKKELLINAPFISPMAAIWKKDGTAVIVKEFQSQEPTFQLISLAPQKDPVPIKKGVRYILWDESENNIIYTYQDSSGKVSINRALPDGSEWKELSAILSPALFIQLIPKSPLIAFWNKPANTQIGEMKTLNISTKEIRTLFSGKYGANYLWSPNGEKILMSWSPEKNTSRITLSVMDKNGGNYTDLKFPTIVEKCVWLKDNITLYCALPGSLNSNAIMPDDFYASSSFTQDTFWKINTETGKSDRLISLEDMPGSFDAVQFLVSPDESELFFINRKDQKLYSIEL